MSNYPRTKATLARSLRCEQELEEVIVKINNHPLDEWTDGQLDRVFKACYDERFKHPVLSDSWLIYTLAAMGAGQFLRHHTKEEWLSKIEETQDE